MAFDISLIGKAPEELTPDELSQVQSYLATRTAAIEARRKVLTETMQATEFAKIVVVANEVKKNLGWMAYPKLHLEANAAGDGYKVDYVITKIKGTGPKKNGGNGKRSTPDVMSGDITINKIIQTVGELDHYEVNGQVLDSEHSNPKAVVQMLKQADGKHEADRCWDIAKKGISASDIITKGHPKEVTMVFKGGMRKLVEDAVAELTAVRKAAEVTPIVPAPAAAGTSEVPV